MKKLVVIACCIGMFLSCNTTENTPEPKSEPVPFVWENANLYFLLTDRFNNGDPSNDVQFNRTKTTGKLRGFEGGDIKGVTQKIEEGYFTDLGVNAIWMTPIVEQIHGGTDEGTGVTYGFHGYWTKDWTAIDPNYGTEEDLKQLVEVAHKKGIRVLLDAVINHTGPVTDEDPVWPSDWVRTSPQCTYDTYENTISCTLVKNLPDIKTESNETVALPPQLVEKWKEEGRYEKEVQELDTFFKRTGYPRAPRFYIMKWLTDYIREFGIDGYRVDTVKHTEEYVWQEFKKECDQAFASYKTTHPKKVLDDNDFYLVGEVYGYGISSGPFYDFGDKKVNYFDQAFNSLINFEFKWNAKQKTIAETYKRYDAILHTELKDYSVLNYLSSHDDGQPFDPNRTKTLEAGTLLLLAPGASQIYYGDESARPLIVAGAEGDANLRSFMNWEALETDSMAQKTWAHYKKLGRFRANHPAVGAGKHQEISETPYVFSRSYTSEDYTDKVVIALEAPIGVKVIPVEGVFENGSSVKDAYSGKTAEVKEGFVTIETNTAYVLLEPNTGN